MAAAFTPARCVKHVRRAVVVRAAVDEDAELEARLAKLKAGKRETTDAEKKLKRAGGGKLGAPGPKKPVYDFTGETVYWEGSTANGDLALNIALGATLVWLPLSLGAIGRRQFLKYRFTDKRFTVSDSFPGYEGK
ncbi:hypothetical protein MNEG_15160 [Monoraphidium neglectum]|uniref:Uncharacterized protein n=1 Tax=Monoraphidium neglectum TaxID=145388 RepID=A0A0D2LLX7_9CHLO|nr:hypothetical protein MNEG_15160 [Monoraphidium neglectum]KIY92804.1 hypothetical protein MNEG_15160 [Monoraphidium neglectum]|eukprot:XP_013891824.1 hypothetical protein MNEG_15160 [Monoraphidium neglectum]